MRRVLAPLLIAMLGAPAPAVAEWIDIPEPTRDEAEHGTTQLVAAIRANDAKAVRARLVVPLTNTGIWFADPACARRFATPGTIEEDEAAAFAACLARLTPQLSTRQPTQRNAGVVTYAPGIEVEVIFAGRRVTAIGPTLPRPAETVPQLTAQAFEALRTGGSTLIDDVRGAELLALAGVRGPKASVSAWLDVCLDRDGRVTRVVPHAASHAAVGAALAQIAQAWTFQPFTSRGAATPACSLTQLVYPASSAPTTETLPPSPIVANLPGVEVDDDDLIDLPAPPPPPTLPRSTLERLRTAGRADLQPTPALRRQMVIAGKLSVSARTKICVDARGHVTSTTIINGSGFVDYDRQLARDTKRWRFRPYLVGKTPTAACTIVLFMVTPDPTMKRP